jgi:replicative DNA helicase|tara:strand:- start:11308 stop:12534 length:1227 start_codon:yes stop_codon:yes gene_type:complete
MELALLRTLTSREFYEGNKSIAKERIFKSKETRAIKNTIDLAMIEYEDDINIGDIEALFFSSNQALTTAQKDIYTSLFRKMDLCDELNYEVAQDVLRELNREDAANELVDMAFKMSNGEITSLHKVVEFIDRREEDFMPALKIAFESMDIDELLKKNDLEFKWKINIPTVAQLVPGVNGGQLIVGAARPNTGKTSCHAFLCAGKDGFLHQGAKVMVLANEEATNRVSARYLTASCNMTIDAIKKDKTKAEQFFKPMKDSLNVADATGWDLDRMERAIKAYKPDILIADMADKFHPEGAYIAHHEKLKATYIRLRILAKQYDCVIFAMSQLSAEAEGKVFVDMSMLEGSRTGKASEADILFCLTKTPMIEGQQEEDSAERHWLVLKNKLTGKHGRVVTMFDPDTATYSA